jgi:hypothetical protein
VHSVLITFITALYYVLHCMSSLFTQHYSKFPVFEGAPENLVQEAQVALKALTDRFTATCTTLQNYAPVMFRRHLSHHLEHALQELDTELSSVLLLQSGSAAVNTTADTEHDSFDVTIHSVYDQRLVAAGEVLQLLELVSTLMLSY